MQQRRAADIVKHATATAAELRPDEFKHGKPLLRHKLDETGPTLVIFTFPKAAKKLFGKAARTGFVDPGVGDGVTYFAMPGPYEKRERRDALLNELKRLIAKTRG